MLQTDLRKIDLGAESNLKTSTINLDGDLDCFIMLSTKDEKLTDVLFHKITDALIDRVHPKNVYKDFMAALENINAFLRTWRHDDGKIKGLHATIGVYGKKTFYFSTIGKASCYLLNTHQDLIEISDSEERSKDFSFISSGDVTAGEILILSSLRLLDTLSSEDIIDGFSTGDLERGGQNIEQILRHESISKNVALISFSKELDIPVDSKWSKEKLSYILLKACDNQIIKNILSYIYHGRDLMYKQSKQVKQVFLALGLLCSIFLLYTLLSSFFHIANQTSSSQQYKESLLEAQEKIVLASENINDEDMFYLNIDSAQEKIEVLESEKLFLSDVEILKDRIRILEKQFNGIESFSTNSENTIYSFPDTIKDVVKVVSISNKIYVVHRDSITGPIFSGQDSENHVFDDLSSGDEFIDAAISDTNIVLMTEQGKVVNFAKNNFFSYTDVLDQSKWSSSSVISSYATNVYLLSDGSNQILRHKKNGQNYSAGEAYLSDEDSIEIGRILSLAIDGGIYILKLDGSIVKLFRSPQYRLESLVINNLPKNYDFQNIDTSKLPSIRARANLKYVYMLLDNRILIFQPNTTNFRDTKSLNYLGQIEGKDVVIKDFYVDNDGEIFIAGDAGIYKMEYSVSEDSILVK